MKKRKAVPAFYPRYPNLSLAGYLSLAFFAARYHRPETNHFFVMSSLDGMNLTDSVNSFKPTQSNPETNHASNAETASAYSPLTYLEDIDSDVKGQLNCNALITATVPHRYSEAPTVSTMTTNIDLYEDDIEYYIDKKVDYTMRHINFLKRVKPLRSTATEDLIPYIDTFRWILDSDPDIKLILENYLPTKEEYNTSAALQQKYKRSPFNQDYSYDYYELLDKRVERLLTSTIFQTLVPFWKSYSSSYSVWQEYGVCLQRPSFAIEYLSICLNPKTFNNSSLSTRLKTYDYHFNVLARILGVPTRDIAETYQSLAFLSQHIINYNTTSDFDYELSSAIHLHLQRNKFKLTLHELAEIIGQLTSIHETHSPTSPLTYLTHPHSFIPSNQQKFTIRQIQPNATAITNPYTHANISNHNKRRRRRSTTRSIKYCNTCGEAHPMRKHTVKLDAATLRLIRNINRPNITPSSNIRFIKFSFSLEKSFVYTDYYCIHLHYRLQCKYWNEIPIPNIDTVSSIYTYLLRLKIQLSVELEYVNHNGMFAPVLCYRKFHLK
ncbi:uncharacterized protein RJT21DRAFT_133591 [Scheffersomyces amazonensis]|uniref:uncharacterized protein n=1 Tax=Scheffersomyces amazonensis TaxID=1078765 RepID=UPI00315CA242